MPKYHLGKTKAHSKPMASILQNMPSTRSLVVLLWSMFLFAGVARAEAPWTSAGAGGQPEIELYFFWSAKCPHCLDARPHVLALPERMPWLKLHDLELSQHPENIRTYLVMANLLRQEINSVPAFMFCGEIHVGWESQHTTGALLAERLEQCHERVLAGQNAESVAPSTTLEAPLLGKVDARRLSLPVFTLIIAGLDAFNPCAFFVLLFLLGLLANQRSRRRMLAIGGIFVLVSGLFYFAFMAAWLNVFRLFGELAWVTAAAGGLAIFIALVNIKDFFAFKQGLSLTIPESRLPDIYRRGRAVLSADNFPAILLATLFLAGAANLYELLCTAGFPMIYTRVLTMNGLSPAEYYLYLAFYNLVYIIPLLVIVLLITFALGRRQLSERQARLLKLMSGVMMLELGVLLLAAPQWLNHVGVAFALLLGAVALTALATLVERGRQA
jgi:hypothetical protein